MPREPGGCRCCLFTPPGRLPRLPPHPRGRGSGLTAPKSRSPRLLQPPRRAAELHYAAWPGLSSFSSLFSAPECALLALAAQGRESPSPPAPGDPPQQMGPGCECARSEGPLRGFAGAPFIARLCVLLRCAGTPPELSPGSLPFPSRRKESAYKGLVCPTSSEGTILL